VFLIYAATKRNTEIGLHNMRIQLFKTVPDFNSHVASGKSIPKYGVGLI
jgi:hypothetical protein